MNPKQLRKERNKRYYNSHKDIIKGKYNPEYYLNNKDSIREIQRQSYIRRKTKEKIERLTALLQFVADSTLKNIIQTHLENIDEIRSCEITTLEKSIVLVVNKAE